MAKIAQIRRNLYHIWTGKMFTFSALSNPLRIEQARNAFSHLDHTNSDILTLLLPDALSNHLETLNAAIHKDIINLWCVQLAEIIGHIFVDPHSHSLHPGIASGLNSQSVAELKTYCQEHRSSEHILENILCKGYLGYILRHIQFKNNIKPDSILQFIPGIDFCLPQTFQALKIQYLLTNLKLDKTQKEDLLFWENECARFPGGNGGTDITSTNDSETHHLPTTVAQIMTGISLYKTSFFALTNFINQTRSQHAQNWLTPYIRGSHTALLYDESTDIEKICFKVK
tara:strand:- start:13138 stop:13992 length:855 start_codon:yes stop_codon:yes gene_type:complete